MSNGPILSFTICYSWTCSRDSPRVHSRHSLTLTHVCAHAQTERDAHRVCLHTYFTFIMIHQLLSSRRENNFAHVSDAVFTWYLISKPKKFSLDFLFINLLGNVFYLPCSASARFCLISYCWCCRKSECHPFLFFLPGLKIHVLNHSLPSFLLLPFSFQFGFQFHIFITVKNYFYFGEIGITILALVSYSMVTTLS